MSIEPKMADYNNKTCYGVTDISSFFPQSSDAASLHALEVLMNEFFDSSTDNNRKREIGI